MTNAESSSVDQKFLDNAMASFVRIAAVMVLLFWCFKIVSPFLSIVVWGAIISVAVYPAHQGISARLKEREKLSAAILVIIGLALIILPAWLLTNSAVQGLQHLAADFKDGVVMIPPPSERVAQLPLIGPKLYEIWSDAAANLGTTLKTFAPQVKSLGKLALSLAGSGVAGLFQFVFAIIIAGALLTTASQSYRAAGNFAASLAGSERGRTLVDLSIDTIRSVVKGVIGVALIQTILAAIGLLVMGVPAAGLWAAMVLVLSIVQLPQILVLGPIAVWVFSVSAPVPASIFLVYALLVSSSDAFLKPLLLGRGVKVPMLVILIGAIGGAISRGFVGLFIGAVILALGYELLTAWISPSTSLPVACDGPESHPETEVNAVDVKVDEP